VKESQSLARVPDTLVYAFEFIMLPTPNEQAADLETLRRTVLRLHPDLKARRRSGCLRASTRPLDARAASSQAAPRACWRGGSAYRLSHTLARAGREA